MPVDHTIHWKPIHDSHYVVASLQPGDGGRRKVFIRQQALARAQLAARATHGRQAFGLLLGHLYECGLTAANYFVVESITEHSTLIDDELNEIVERALQQPPGGKDTQVLGWYRSAASVEARPSSSTTATHTIHFGQPWQVVLVLAENPATPGGAFFLKDDTNSRWFSAPFYELPDHAPAAGTAKPTCVAWPQYLTADDVSFANPESMVERPSSHAERAGRAGGDTAKRQPSGRKGEDNTVPAATTRPSWLARLDTRGRFARGVSGTADTEGQQVLRQPPDGALERRLRDVPEQTPREQTERREMQGTGFSDRPVRLPSVDDRDQRRVSHPIRLVTDTDDTTSGDEPARYLEIARADGFFVAAKFEALNDKPGVETLWVLNEPFSGFLLTVVSTSDEVVDASLHYNLHTDDAGLQRTPFPEHRDPDSHTIYLRETCIEGLRAKCQRLRATNALLREWKVSPTMPFIMPGEWQSLGVSSADDAVDAVHALNSARIADLPDGVRTQFQLADRDERSA